MPKFSERLRWPALSRLGAGMRLLHRWGTAAVRWLGARATRIETPPAQRRATDGVSDDLVDPRTSCFEIGQRVVLLSTGDVMRILGVRRSRHEGWIYTIELAGCRVDVRECYLAGTNGDG
jgi:hypothetical protein